MQYKNRIRTLEKKLIPIDNPDNLTLKIAIGLNGSESYWTNKDGVKVPAPPGTYFKNKRNVSIKVSLI